MMDNYCLNDDDVVFVEGGIEGAEPRSYKVSEFIHALREFASGRSEEYLEQCLSDGGICQCLQTRGGGWQKGKIYIKLQFIPDEPSNKSPLDDLRNDLNL